MVESSQNLAAAAAAGALVGAAVVVALSRRAPSIVRFRDQPRFCAALVHKPSKIVFLAGQVGIVDKLAVSDVAEQTKQTLAKIDELLAEAGTNKKHILSTQIWLKNIIRDSAAMNEVWNAWVHTPCKGVRACVQAEMGREEILVEIKVTAALPS